MLPILLWDITYFLALFEWGFNFAGVYNGLFVVCFILAWLEQAVIARFGLGWMWEGERWSIHFSHTVFVFFTFSCDVDFDSKAAFILFLSRFFTPPIISFYVTWAYTWACSHLLGASGIIWGSIFLFFVFVSFDMYFWGFLRLVFL